LRDVLTRLPSLQQGDALDEFLPDVWLRHHPAARRAWSR
jgi:hypothetical protein